MEKRKQERKEAGCSISFYDVKKEKIETKESGKDSFILPVVFSTPFQSGDTVKNEFLINCVRASIIGALSMAVVLLQRAFGVQHISKLQERAVTLSQQRNPQYLIVLHQVSEASLLLLQFFPSGRLLVCLNYSGYYRAVLTHIANLFVCFSEDVMKSV